MKCQHTLVIWHFLSPRLLTWPRAITHTPRRHHPHRSYMDMLDDHCGQVRCRALWPPHKKSSRLRYHHTWQAHQSLGLLLRQVWALVSLLPQAFLPEWALFQARL